MTIREPVAAVYDRRRIRRDIRPAVMDRRYRMIRFWLFVFLLFSFASRQSALGDSQVSIAAAANLVYVLGPLNAEFKRAHPDVTVTTTTSASGNLFAQIKNGAPVDVFLSADTVYPHQLVEDGAADRDTLQTFATGRLVFWTTRETLDVSDIAAVVRSPAVRKIALAQPKTAPYGRAAQAALEKLGVWQEAERKLVLGESITQTTQFIETGNADAGFVALSVVLSPRLANQGKWVEIAPEDYANAPLDHAGVLTRRGTLNPAARRYLAFFQSESAKKILREFGYGVK